MPLTQIYSVHYLGHGAARAVRHDAAPASPCRIREYSFARHAAVTVGAFPLTTILKDVCAFIVEAVFVQGSLEVATIWKAHRPLDEAVRVPGTFKDLCNAFRWRLLRLNARAAIRVQCRQSFAVCALSMPYDLVAQLSILALVSRTIFEDELRSSHHLQLLRLLRWHFGVDMQKAASTVSLLDFSMRK